MNIIMKSGKKNWSGKEFSSHAAKIYSSFDDAITALNSYHFFTFDNEKCDFFPCDKMEKIEIVPLTENAETRLLADGRIRW